MNLIYTYLPWKYKYNDLILTPNLSMKRSKYSQSEVAGKETLQTLVTT
jgi:hypothetical protein